MRGITITLYETAPAIDPVTEKPAVDAFGVPVLTESAVNVDDVLVGEPTTEDIATSTALYQKQIRFMLGIPKGDTHDWMDKKVSWADAYGRTIVCRTFGYPITGVEANIPTRWHMKVRCEDYG